MSKLDYILIKDVNDLEENALLEKELLQMQEIKSIIIVPLSFEKELIGFIGFDSVRNFKKWEHKDINILENLANIITRSIIHIRDFKIINSEKETSKLYLDLAGSVIIIIGPDLKIKRINKKGTDVLGFQVKEVIGKNFFDEFTVSEEKDSLKNIYRGLMIGNISELNDYLEFAIINSKKEVKTIEWYNSLLKTGKKIEGIILAGKDITLKKNEDIEISKNFTILQKTAKNLFLLISKIVEFREPFTMGHHSRVADIAYLIAKEINLSDKMIDCICKAAMLHDIGKIFVPAEILNKPRRLTNTDMEIVKIHSSAALDFLSSIDFNSPVALVISQHHEMIDGSGYTNGLKNDEIMIEAKILAVAETVEALSQPRIYRMSKSLVQALSYIKENSGKLYDRKIVNACLKIYNSI